MIPLPDFRQTIRIDKQTGNYDYLAVKYEHVGIVFLEACKFRTAERAFKRSLGYFALAGDQDSKAELLCYWAVMEFERGDRDQAAIRLGEGLKLARSLEVDEFIHRSSFLELLFCFKWEATPDKLVDLLESAVLNGHHALVLDLEHFRFILSHSCRNAAMHTADEDMQYGSARAHRRSARGRLQRGGCGVALSSFETKCGTLLETVLR